MKFNLRIVLAVFFGVILIAGSFFLSKNQRTGPEEQLAKVEDSNTTFRSFIEVNDNDKNGLPDWVENLNLPTIEFDDEPEDTLSQTGSLAIELATLTSAGNADPQAISLDIRTRLIRESYDKQYTKDDVLIKEDNSGSALRLYGNQVATIAIENAPPNATENELTILNRALLRDDPTILNLLNPTIDS